MLQGDAEVMVPKEQLQLTETELDEEITKMLTANNPGAPTNLARYNHKVPTLGCFSSPQHPPERMRQPLLYWDPYPAAVLNYERPVPYIQQKAHPHRSGIASR